MIYLNSQDVIQIVTILRHCVYEILVGASSCERAVDKVMMIFAENERRGNLLSVAKSRGFFINFGRNTLLRSQCREIASRMQQCSALLKLVLNYAEARNDEMWCERRKLYRSQNVVHGIPCFLW
jgi:hypothetical protein